jgi:hypothetical protein
VAPALVKLVVAKQSDNWKEQEPPWEKITRVVI